MWRSNQLSYRTVAPLKQWTGPGDGRDDNGQQTTPQTNEGGDGGRKMEERASWAEGKAPLRRSRKEVFQPHLPVRLPCYDLAPITGVTLGRASRQRTSGAPDFHGLTGGVYKARERIHRAMADARLLANPASWSRVAGSSPNWEGI